MGIVRRSFRLWLVGCLAVGLLAITLWLATAVSGQVASTSAANDLVFIHHSVGSNWLNHSLHDALLVKPYIDQRNDVTYGTILTPDPGRPASLGSVPGDLTDMRHWILWFNDYLGSVKSHGSGSYNRIIMFKSCYPNSNIGADGTEPGDPFNNGSLVNYKAIYRHPDGPGQVYTANNTTYRPLEDIFAENPDVLFIPVTAPPLCATCNTTDENAHRARLFNQWLVQEWLPAYHAAHPGLNNVAVFNFFDLLANPDTHPSDPNRLQDVYTPAPGNSHPNDLANGNATALFATNPGNFIDRAWSLFNGQTAGSWTAAKTASIQVAAYQNSLTYTLLLQNGGISPTPTAFITDVIPAGLVYTPGTLTATGGTVNDSAAPTLSWTGNVANGRSVTITYRVRVNGLGPQFITNQAQFAVPGAPLMTRTATILIDGYTLFVPILYHP